MQRELRRTNGTNRAEWRPWRNWNRAVERAFLGRIWPAPLFACVVFLGIGLARHQAAHRRASTLVTPAQLPSRFEVSFARARHWYFQAQLKAKHKLESVEEWDGAALLGSAPDRYRRSLMARARETGLAETAALEAAHRAQTVPESYAATRLLVHIESDLGHHQAAVEQARKLSALQYHHVEALLLLRTAEREYRQSGGRSE